ncbi:MAG: hypothetical protein JRG90_10550 [Deltaproteobacteria bacterium]|nr:hypothetical protein [Deltaproteobacteria bacterium]
MIVVLGILALAAALSGHENSMKNHSMRRSLESAVLALLVAIGVLFNGAGAISSASTQWNFEPTLLRHSRERVFDWKRPQWAVALFPQHYGGAEGAGKNRDRM